MRTDETVMPAEWTPHSRTWMAFPPPNHTFGKAGSDTLEAARRAWATVAQTIARYEPVTMVTSGEDAAAARELLGDNVSYVSAPLNDAWMRDIGPTFTVSSDGSLAAIDWNFNGWGGQTWARFNFDNQVASAVGAACGAPTINSPLTNEGGGFHVDGAGTVLLTDTVQLDPGRNPGWSRAEVEAEIHARLGTSKAIWLPRGLTRDYDEFGTRGHVDIVAAFAPGNIVLVHDQTDPAHPDHLVSKEIRNILETSTNASGERFTVMPVPAPVVLEDDGQLVDYSYLNHYVVNGAVILCAFHDPHDARAAAILQQVYPDRVIEMLDARGIFAHGGGIHCITQQQPLTQQQPAISDRAKDQPCT